jgi:hypothetical protein
VHTGCVCGTLVHSLQMTADERKIADVLIEHRPTENAWEGPIQEAGKSMRWDSVIARDFVEDMRSRGLVQIESKAKNRNDAEDNRESWWELGDGAGN